MLRALPPLILAIFPAIAWAQTPPPPDTKPARERHRQMEHEPPPPGGPLGPEEFGITWNPPVWRGIYFEASATSGASLATNVPRGVATFSDGVNPPIFERLEYHGERFRTWSAGATVDLDAFRLSAVWFDGGFDARTTLTYEDGFQPPQSSSQEIHGNAYGFRLGAYWPGLRYRDTMLEASIGPALTVGWMHQELFVPGGVLLHRDTLDILTGTFGPKASFRLSISPGLTLETNLEYSFLTGALRGWTKEVTIGLGMKF